MLSLDQFISQTDNTPVDVDKAYGAQCWDLVELYAQQVLNVPKEPWAIPLGPEKSAKEAWTCYDQSEHMQKYFDKIPAGQQQKGDITVYDGHGVYTDGHIAISLGGNSVFEQNADPDGSLAHVYNNRSSTYLLGALRKKGDNMPTISQAAYDDFVAHKAQSERFVAAMQAAGLDPYAPDLTALYKDLVAQKAYAVRVEQGLDAVGISHDVPDFVAFFKDFVAHKEQSLKLESQLADLNKGATILKPGQYVVE